MVPWAALCRLIEPFYPKPGNGRPPIGVERMLRIYFLQQWFNLSDPAVEEALYDSAAMRGFVGIDLGREPVPDETTVCRFRHLLEAHDLGRRLFDEVQRHLAEKGLKIATGTIVDATIISAPVFDQERRQGARSRDASDQEGQPVVFRHEGAYRRRQPTKLIHAVVGDAGQRRGQQGAARTAARRETRVWGDQAYRGQRGGDPPNARRGRGTSSTAAIAIAASWTKSSGRRTAPNRRCGPRWSIRSGSSSGCSASPRCATAGSRRTLIASGDLRPGQSVHRPPPTLAGCGGVVHRRRFVRLHRGPRLIWMSCGCEVIETSGGDSHQGKASGIISPAPGTALSDCRCWFRIAQTTTVPISFPKS